MAKDSYWFRHDSTAGRGLRMRKMAHIHGHWGKGVYWDVIEILRDQSNYCFDYDDSSLQMLADLIGCKDVPKFITWMRDCVQLDLLQVQDDKFYSSVLCENMGKWEIKKRNGSEPKSETEAKRKHKRREENIIIEKKIEIRGFNKPSLLEIKNYCIERKNTVSPEKFFDYYESNGWRVGKNPMKNWQASVRTWEKSNFEVPKSKSPHTLTEMNYEERP